MDSRAAFDAWLADTPFTAVADTIYERFNKSIALEECLDTVDPENPTLASFRIACDPITFTTLASPYRWIPMAFLYDLKSTSAHKKAVDRAVRAFPDHLHTESDVERDLALAIYITYADTEEPEEDDTPFATPSYAAFLDEEPAETLLPLQEEEEQSQALILHPSIAAQPVAVENLMVTPLASLTPLAIDGVEYLLLQDVLEVLEMREEELFSNLTSCVDDSFVDFEVEDQPPAIDEVGRYDGTSLSTLGAIEAVQKSIAQAAPEYDIPFEEFEALQNELFGPRPQQTYAAVSNEEVVAIPGCDLSTEALAEQDHAEQVGP